MSPFHQLISLVSQKGLTLACYHFCTYVLPLGHVSHKHNIKFHCYLDYIQLCVPLKTSKPSYLTPL